VAHARVQTADYISDLCAELITMAQAEAEMAREQVI